MMSRQRKIIHIDMDAFFASVEQRDRPELRGHPVVVGGQPDRRGVVAACSYEARQFGIHSAMPSSRAYRLCPKAVFVPPRIDVYRQVSEEIHAIFWRYGSDVEPLSLDEAYIDVTHSEQLKGSATRIAQAIKQDIQTETKLTASAGVSYNKFLAKIASDMDKPDGLYVITPEQGPDFVARLPIGQFYGVGPATEAKMQKLGITNGEDLRALNKTEVKAYFGKVGEHYYHISRGIDHRPVRSTRVRKSLGKETTFNEDVHDTHVLMEHIKDLAEKVFQRLEDKGLLAKTVTLKVKYSDFQQVTRAMSSELMISELSRMQSMLAELLLRTQAAEKAVRLVGVTASGLVNKADADTKKQLEINLDING